MATIINYIENCIFRILQAPCDDEYQNKRTEDLAAAFKIARQSGIEAVHKYLVRISSEAEAGKYKRNGRTSEG
jgi:hypothetical protein